MFLVLFVSGQACPPLSKRISKVKSLNTIDKAEAYPHLSADGLRLYYTAQKDSGFGRMYYAQRNSVDEAFSNYRPLSPYLTDYFFAGSLTADELTMYLCKRSHIYVSKRASHNEPFSEPVEVEEIVRGFAPAISPDGMELMVQQSIERSNHYELYRKDKNGIFRRSWVLSIPLNLKINPGQFSKNGLTFNLTADQNGEFSKETDSTFLLKFVRASSNDSFGKCEVKMGVNSSARITQISYNADESILVGVTSEGRRWKENNLVYIQQIQSTPKQTINANKVDTLKLEMEEYTLKRSDTSKYDKLAITLRLTNNIPWPVNVPIKDVYFQISNQLYPLCADSIDYDFNRVFRCSFGRVYSPPMRLLPPGESLLLKHEIILLGGKDYRIHFTCRPYGSNVFAQLEWIVISQQENFL